MKVIWLQPALDSLSDVWDYSVGAFGIPTATETENGIFSAIDRLEVFPLMGSIVEEISNELREYRRIKIRKTLSVIYRIEYDTIYIVFVWDNRRSLHNIFYFFNDL